MAALAAAFAKTLGEQDTTFVPRLKEHLDTVYAQIREGPADNIGAMEMLGWVRELLRK